MLLALHYILKNKGANEYMVQPLDNRTLGRLESAVQKSSYVGEGKRLKVTNEVSLRPDYRTLLRGSDSDRPRSTPRLLEALLLRLATGPLTFLSHPRLPR